jgi:hypothetical protein
VHLNQLLVKEVTQEFRIGEKNLLIIAVHGKTGHIPFQAVAIIDTKRRKCCNFKYKKNHMTFA